MTLEADVNRFGAKGAVLKYIHETDSSIPIEPFVLVPVGEDWRLHLNDIERLGDSLVRSSSPLEDGKKISFAGIFGTEKFALDGSVQYVLNSANSLEARRYARIHGIEGPIEMALVFQRDSKSYYNWSILRHPHMSNLLFAMGRPVDDRARVSRNYVFDERTKTLHDVVDYNSSRIDGRKRPEEGMWVDLETAIKTYKKIESMPEFQTDFAYQMEFGTTPFSVYQFRPFRKKEKASWTLKRRRNLGIFDNEYSICFGITPPEGYELKLVRGLNSNKVRNHVNLYSKLTDEGKSREEIIKELMKEAEFNEQERIYAEMITRIPKDTLGSVETKAYELALRKLNRQLAKDETCLYQEDMHNYYGKGSDLVFPNAKVWVPQGALQFLSHEWFRPLQHYDVSLLGYASLGGKTGDKVRVFSDGVRGLIIQSK